MICSTRFFFATILFTSLEYASVSGYQKLIDFPEFFKRLPKYCFERFLSTDLKQNLLHKNQPCDDDVPTALKGQDVCKKLFKEIIDDKTLGEEHYLDPLCINPNYQQEILWCAKTCKLCCLRPEYSCIDRPPFNVTTYCQDFKTDQKKCEEEPQKAKYCPRSCGKCETEKDHCEDKHLGCEYMKEMCSEEKHKLKMDRLCPKTCDKENNNNSACTKISELNHFRRERVPLKMDCKDSGHNCAQNIMLCEDEYYIDKMTKNCPSTCGHCVQPSFVCEDKNGSPCDKWKSNKFCDVDGIYPKAVMLQHCAKTCDICHK
uniref:ShKT domain-containing protein n=1 Tax=Ditylenchus dipsaci TaxID=166011 RepID=A0A915EJA1_9BILA